MDRKEKAEVVRMERYTRYVVAHHVPGRDPAMDRLAEYVSDPQALREFDLLDSIRNTGAPPFCVDLENGWFVVYLPPPDPQFRPCGYEPSQAAAEEEFREVALKPYRQA